MKKCIYFVLFLFLAAGCQNTQLEQAELQIDQLQAQKTTLADQVAMLEKENNQLTKQVQALRSFPGVLDYKEIYDMQRIELTGFTNIYDNNTDGKKETLIVYVRTIDETGDSIKAAGLAEVQLWDLEKPAEQALLKQWKVERAELEKMWVIALLGTNFSLKFNVEGAVVNYDHPLTVKVKFTDYLSGKTFEEQKVITPQ